MTPRRRLSASVGPDLWLLAVSLAAGLGTARLTRSPGAARLVVPIAVTVVAGHVGATVARRLRFPAAVVLAAGLVSVALATVWGQLLSATRHGLPTPTTWRTLVSTFDAAGAVIRSHPTPVPVTHAVVLCIATGAGLVAVLGGSLWAWYERRRGGTLVALVPSFGLFCYTALLSSQVDRVQGVVSYVVAALGFVVVADRATGAGAPWERGDVAPSRGRRGAGAALAALPAVGVAALAVAVPLAATPALATLKVDALPFPQPPASATPGLGLAAGNGTDGLGGNGGGGGPGVLGVQAIDLVDNLRAVLVNRTGEVMFSAQSAVPTYWQVAVLTEFDGTAWLPDPTTEAAAQSFALSPQSKEVAYLPALPQPAPTKTFSATITIGALESTLLPLPPTTVSVDTAADFVPGFGVVQPVEAPPGKTYTAVAGVPANPTASGVAASGSTSGTVPAASLAPYLKLPSEPARVVALAHRIVAGAKTPAAKAAAVARWFNSGRYRYTLSPPAPKRSDALQSFLFTAKAGFCQQFAAAYGVLARLDGLPTRVAVGFTTGQTTGRGRYRVTGADAHVWPEVYLGPSTGWTSYEPTPASSGEATGVGVNSGSKASKSGPGSRSTSAPQTTQPPQRRPLQPNGSVPTTAPLVPGTRRGTAAGTHPSPGTGLAAAVVVVIIALVAGVAVWLRRLSRGGWSPFAAWRRRRRHHRGRHTRPDPTTEVLAQWHEAAAGLERARLGRRPAETLEEHAARLRSLAGAHWLSPHRPVTTLPGLPGVPVPESAEPGTTVTIEATVDAYARLTALAGRASYSSGPCTDGDAAAAARLGATVRSGLARPGHSRGVLVSS